MWRALASVILATTVVSCGGGSNTTAPNGNNGNNPPNNQPGGSVKVVTATINGAPFTATTVVGAWLNGAGISITAQNATRTISISANNVPGPGTITFGIGNQWSALAQIVGDATNGTFSTGFGGTGSLTLTTATLFRITGTFTFTAYTVAGGGLGQPVVTVTNGTFDISNP